MKLKVLFACLIITLILINKPVFAQKINIEVLISNYGYGTGVITTNKEGWSGSVSTSIKGDSIYTRAALKYHTQIQKRIYYGSLALVTHKRRNQQKRKFDIGVGKEIELSPNSYFTIEGGYSTATFNNYYYIIGLNWNWSS